MKRISTTDLKQTLSQSKDDVVLIDVREPTEFATGHIPGAKNMPLETLKNAAEDLKIYTNVIVACAGGSRCSTAYEVLEKEGVSVTNATEGMRGWREAGFEIET